MSLMIEEIDAVQRNLEQTVDRAHQGAAGAGSRIAGAEPALRRGAFEHVARPGDVRRRCAPCSSAISASSRHVPALCGQYQTRHARCNTILDRWSANGTFSGNPEALYRQSLRQDRSRTGDHANSSSSTTAGPSRSCASRCRAAAGWRRTRMSPSAGSAEMKIAHMARHDALTDLPNRVLLRERLERGARAGRARPTACRAVSRSRPVQERQRYARPPDRRRVVARWWPQRLRGCVQETRHDLAASAATNFSSSRPMSATQPTPNGWRGASPKRSERLTICTVICVMIDASIGIALAPADGTDANELLKNADMALYGAKADGRGVFRFFEAEHGRPHEGAARARARAAQGVR